MIKLRRIDLLWRSITEGFSRTSIKDHFDHFDLLMSDLLDGGVFGDVLADEFVGVLDSTALPGGVGSGEVDRNAKGLGGFGVTDELAAIVIGESFHVISAQGAESGLMYE